jgi:type IV pilus assembly protein PilE
MVRSHEDSWDQERALKSKHRGFTLIEVMITAAIIAILAAVAYPSYTRYVVRGKRAAAQAIMYTAVSKQEQYMLNARSFTSNFADLKVNVAPEVSNHYTLTTTADNAATPPTYYVEAAPTGGQATADSRCGTLRLTNAGVKTASGGGTDCW